MARILTAVALAIAIAVALNLGGRAGPQPPAQAASTEAAPLTAAAARELIAAGALVADVREPDELAVTGRLKGAINVPLSAIEQAAATGAVPPQLAAARDRPLILYCRSGRRSAEAGRILAERGFVRLYNLGGFEDAVKGGLPAA